MYNSLYYKSENCLAFRTWLETAIGLKFSEIESKVINSAVPNIFGYYAVILSEPNFAESLQACSIKNKSLINPNLDTSALNCPISAISARHDKLPLDTESIDLVYLAHTLEFTNNPHEVLRETHRILRADGHVLITIFNPWSLWGIWRLLVRWRNKAPWRANFRSLEQLKDWLALLGFDIMRVNHFGYCLPFKIRKASSKISIIEKYGQKIGLPFGAAYMIEASKRVIPVTPIKPEWLTERDIVAEDAAAPTV